MSGILNASCCCGGGTLPPGNTVCVPIVGTTTPTFTITASQAGWVRGEPKGLSDSTVQCACETCESKVKIWSGWNNAIGAFEGKMWRDGWNGQVDPETCECCDITSDTINYVGGSWTATLQFTGASGLNVLSESNTFTEFGTVSGGRYLCSAISVGANTCPTSPCTVCCNGASGLYDIVVVTFSGQNKSAPYYDTQYIDPETGSLKCDPPYDPAYERNYYYQYNAYVYYAKPVPFAATRTLTGVYTRYAAKVLVPQNFYQTSVSGPAESLSYSTTLFCTAIIGPTPPNDPECLCGTANGYGFTFPATITLT
jgi:hypothetical protein